MDEPSAVNDTARIENCINELQVSDNIKEDIRKWFETLVKKNRKLEDRYETVVEEKRKLEDRNKELEENIQQQNLKYTEDLGYVTEELKKERVKLGEYEKKLDDMSTVFRQEEANLRKLLTASVGENTRLRTIVDSLSIRDMHRAQNGDH